MCDEFKDILRNSEHNSENPLDDDAGFEEFCEKNLPTGELLKRLNSIMEKRANSSLNEEGITISQMKMMVILHIKGSQTLKELEKYFDTAQATTAGIAMRLEKKGLIEGFYSQQDKRVKHIKLTGKGKDLCERNRNAMVQNERWIMSSLDMSEKKELHRILYKIYNNISGQRKEKELC